MSAGRAVKTAPVTRGDGSPTRALFLELVTQAREELGQQPSQQATGYLVDLLDGRVRTLGPLLPPDGFRAGTLGEALLEALLEEGSSRLARLRALGDQALFDAGFFGASLRRRAVGVSYYTDIGRTAYARLSSGLGRRVSFRSASEHDIFYELAVHFGDFVELLAEVGERARGCRQVDLLRLYERYLESGRESDRQRLLRHGLIPSSGETPQ